MAISDFKARCISVLKQAQRRGEPLIVTLRGRPLARIEPLTAGRPERRLGALRDLGEIRGDIVHADSEEDWEAGG